MHFIIEDVNTLDPVALADELIAAFGTNYGISTAGNTITTNGGEPDPIAFQAVIDVHVSNADTREQNKLKASIKHIREVSLEKFPKNSGVDNVYVLNYQAATLGSDDTTTILRNGKTPAAHLGDFGVHIGMTAAQFAAYVLSENLLAGQKMTEIEAEYLRLYYNGPMTDEDVAGYQSYCDARTL
jgi:hypothetical protein